MQTILLSGKDKKTLKEYADRIIKNIIVKEKLEVFRKGVDYKEVGINDEASKISIAQVREIIIFINIKPVSGGVKVIEIFDAQLLSHEAQNALLKTLEEPPAYAQIIIHTSYFKHLLPTIISRCKLYIVNKQDTFELNSMSEEEEKYAKDLLKMLKEDMGARIDWITENKEMLKNKQTVELILDSWEKVLRLIILAAVKDDSSLKTIKQLMDQSIRPSDVEGFTMSIRYLKDLKLKIINHNANSQIGLETFLISLPYSMVQ
jgi:DNA polymerase III subunit gamma/tau